MPEFSPRLRLLSLVLGASVLVAFASTGCVTHHHHYEGTCGHTAKAPPRSAADGYVHHYYDVVLVFDRSWNGYWVKEHPDHYFYVDHYYRWHGGRWQKAQHFKGPWVSVESRALPAGLRNREAAKERQSQTREEAREQRQEARGAAKQKREEEHQAAKERRSQHREEAQEERQEARGVAKQKREEEHQAAKERRGQHREEAQEERQEARSVAKQKRGEEHQAAKERQSQHREEAREERQEARSVAKQKRGEVRQAAEERQSQHRETAREGRGDRHEIAASQKTRRAAEPAGDLARGPAKQRGRTAPEAVDGELPANNGVE